MRSHSMFASVLVALAMMCNLATAEENGFKPIFDGKTLDGWDGDAKYWRVEDGAITGQTTAEKPTPKNTFLIWRGGEPADFELRLQFKLANHNSGIQYRSRELKEIGKWAVGGYQADMDGEDQYTGMLYDEHGRGILAQRGEKVVVGKDHKPKVTGKTGDAAELRKIIKKADWNEYRIVAKGNHLQHYINGHLTADVIDDDPQMRDAEGILALQIHAGPPMKVQFRDIRIKK